MQHQACFSRETDNSRNFRQKELPNEEVHGCFDLYSDSAPTNNITKSAIKVSSRAGHNTKTQMAGFKRPQRLRPTLGSLGSDLANLTM